MVIGDRRFAAQLRDGRQVYRFDDVGCALLWQQDHPDRAFDEIWVRDAGADADGWLDAHSARFAGGAASPMEYGFEARAAGEGLSLEAIRPAIWEIERERRDRRGR
jgi:copper chaperone NosL